MARPATCGCGSCGKCRHRAYMRAWQAAHPGYAAAVARRRRHGPGGDAVREYERTGYHANPTPQRARMAVFRAVRRGDLTRPDSCATCGRACKPEAHHPDYARPLDVVWLCKGCHEATHQAETIF